MGPPGSSSVVITLPLSANLAARNTDPSVSSISEYVASLATATGLLPKSTSTMSRAGMVTFASPVLNAMPCASTATSLPLSFLPAVVVTSSAAATDASSVRARAVTG